jgi:hypothetical protein
MSMAERGPTRVEWKQFVRMMAIYGVLFVGLGTASMAVLEVTAEAEVIAEQAWMLGFVCGVFVAVYFARKLGLLGGGDS